jgi:nitroreductase
MKTTTSLLPAIESRRSWEQFDPAHPLSPEDLVPLLEAARSAPSSYNLQPWRFAWELRGAAAFARILGVLDPGNTLWAQDAGALVVGCAVLGGRGGAANGWAEHDLGLATSQLVLQAVSSGLAAHTMGGFDAVALRRVLDVPAGLKPLTVTALGWPATGVRLPARNRLPLAEVALRGGWA